MTLNCNASLFHYNGYCFNKSRIPKGQIALPAEECQKLDQEKEVVATIIN